MHTIRTSIRAALALGVLAANLAAPAVHAGQADISSTPLQSTTSAQVKPNIMLLMDTSGSMGWSHMPDEMEAITGVGSVGYKSSQCNALYYNPAQRYAVPKQGDGSLFPTPSFTDAPYTGYLSYLAAPDTIDSSRVDLSSAFRAYDGKTLRLTSATPDLAQPAYYYVYTGSQTLNYATAPCTDTDTGATRAATATDTGSGTWTRVVVPTAQQTNFAIWYSYYRTRIALTKSAASLAFTPLTDSFRVGFITMQPKDNPTDAAINAAKYVAINDFDSTQRSAWFRKLFSQVPGGASPAREGLARVGRHYGGKQDGINTGMTGDPVQYSCQQNFTIMTTDGYWNTQTETPGAGPVQLDGVTPVRQQDGPITPASGLAPRPIYDGSTDSNRITEDNQNTYSYGACGSFAYLSTTQVRASTNQVVQTTTQAIRSTTQAQQSTVQILQSTTQNLQSATGITVSTSQNLQSTSQNLRSTAQTLQSTTRVTLSTAQMQQRTTQNLQSTTQNLLTTSQTIQTTTVPTATVTIDYQSTNQPRESTSQITRSTTQPRQSTTQRLQTKVQNLKSTIQNRQSTAQVTQSTAQTLQSTTQTRQSTTQNLQSTTQITRSTAQITQSTSQTMRSTSQTTITTSQTRKTVTTHESCNAQTELCVSVASGSCTPGGFITCQRTVTGPTLVASCENQNAAAGNNYTQVVCTTTTTGPNGASSCTPSGPTATNSYTTTTCTNNPSGPTAVQFCSPANASPGNSWTATTCDTTPTGPTGVQSCTSVPPSAGNNWTTTSCGANNTGPVGVASCTAVAASAGNSWSAVNCGNSNTSSVPVSSCSASGPTPGNGYVNTTCSANTTTNVPVASCTPSGPTSGNGYTTTSCSPNNTANVPVQTCSAALPSSGNNYTTTTCAPNNSGPTGVSSCSASAPNAGNNWTNTTCGNATTTNVPVASCTASGPTSANSWTTTTCPAPIVTTNVASQTCTPAAAASTNNWTTTTCSTTGPNNTSNVPVQTCTASAGTSGNSWVTTTCTDNNTTNVVVGSCTASGATVGNNWTTTTCNPNNTGPTGVASCTQSAGTSGNSWVTTTCANPVTTNVAVSSCTQANPSSGNGYLTRTCSPVSTGPTAVASCTGIPGTAGNSWVTTSCSTTTVSGPTVVGSCTPVPPTAGNGFRRTSCGTQVTNIAVASCTAGGNITCGNSGTGPTPVQTCSISGPNAANNYTTTGCSTNNNPNVPVASCSASGPSSTNSWVTTTCPTPVTTGPVFVSSCSTASAIVANNFTSTTCTPVNTGPTAVASCTPSGPTGANNWTTTTCPPVVTTDVPVQTCTASGPTSANLWTTTTCRPSITTDVAVQTCSGSGPTSGNSWTTTTCRPNNASNVPVQSCTASGPTAGNNWVTTTCPQAATTGPTGTPSCTEIPASATNGWVTTSCGQPTTTNVPVQSCTPSGPTSANGYVTTTCSTANNTTDVPVASCTASDATASNGWVTTACRAATTGPSAVANCTPLDASSTTNYVKTTCANTTTGPTPVASCTTIPPLLANGYTETTCTASTAANVPVASCTASAGTAANGWVNTTCPAPVVTTDLPVASCANADAGAGNSWTSTTCRLVSTGPTLLTAGTQCAPEPASAGNNWTTSTCVTRTDGQRLNYKTTHIKTSTPISGGTAVGAPVVIEGPTQTVGQVGDGFCYAPDADPPPPAPPAPDPSGNGRPGPNPPTGCTAWPCSDNTPSDVGSVNSLADVAQYYYVTDLRPDMLNTDSTNWVPAIGSGPEDDRVHWQHMTTFSIALGVSGTLDYRSDYKSTTTTTGDFADIRTGAKSWPLWPDPAVPTPPAPGGTYDNWNNPRSIDDFWHAAVNGRGQYFSAASPDSVVSGLSGALAGISARLSAGAAPGASTLQPTAGDNEVFVPQYTTGAWFGQLTATSFDLSTGDLGTESAWDAMQKLDAMTQADCDNRTIYLIRQGAANNMVPFTWNTKTCGTASTSSTTSIGTPLNTDEVANFGADQIRLLSQHPSMTDGTLGSADQITAAAGENLLNFLRGQRGKEDFQPDDAGKLYRKRAHVLGDIIGGQPAYVRGPTATYQDAGYLDFKAANASRTAMVYVPANDGMLHAFYASATDPLGGTEAWAIIPSAVLPGLYKLADNNYANVHKFYVDGVPVVGDVRDPASSTWRTVLVGGLNAGGKGYYAVDITDPAAPKVLWEFKNSATTCFDNTAATSGADCHLGLTFGKPVITKIRDTGARFTEGRWVVLVSSGYNNVRGAGLSGDGQGYLYVLDAMTGSILYKIGTGAGDASTPSNLGQLRAYVDDASVTNITSRVYGGDMLGNVWRFDLGGTQAPLGSTAVRLGQAKDASGRPQPITTRVELAEINSKPMVILGTGRLLGTTDFGDLQKQSIYGIVDQLTGDPVYEDLRLALKPMVMTMTGSGASRVRTVACSTATGALCASPNGWFLDLPDGGERINIDMSVVLSTLVAVTNVPATDPCDLGGYSWLNNFDLTTGEANGALGTGAAAARVSTFLTNSLAVGLNVIRSGDRFYTVTRTAGSENGWGITSTREYPPMPNPSGKRISWREITQ